MPHLLGPAPWHRALLASLGVIIAAIGVIIWVGAPRLVALALIWIVAGAVMSVRMYQIGIVVRSDRLHVRGVLFSRTIARSSVRAVRLPYIDWTDKEGTPRSTLSYAFMGSKRASNYNREIREDASYFLDEWIKTETATS